MNLKDFKAIYGKYPTDKQLYAMLETAELIANAKRDKTIAYRNANNKDVEYFEKEEIHMWNRMEWLCDVLIKKFERLENKVKAYEEVE